MAKATRIDPEPAPPVIIRLELTEEEAKTLALIVRNIGGPPTGPRGHMDAIHSALRAVSVAARPDSTLDRGRSSMYFKQDPAPF